LNQSRRRALYETPWFARALHYGAMLLGTLMVLLLGVRPLIKAIRGDKPKQKPLSTKEAKKRQAKGRGARRRRGRSQGSRRADGRRRPARSGRHFARIRDDPNRKKSMPRWSNARSKLPNRSSKPSPTAQ
jgi:flagellar biosynthesis/type III secretory pathway M-ring protein FliF/YscJ